MNSASVFRFKDARLTAGSSLPVFLSAIAASVSLRRGASIVSSMRTRSITRTDQPMADPRAVCIWRSYKNTTVPANCAARMLPHRAMSRRADRDAGSIRILDQSGGLNVHAEDIAFAVDRFDDFW